MRLPAFRRGPGRVRRAVHGHDGVQYLKQTAWTRLRLEAVQMLVDPHPGERVLDLGSAAGAISHFLSVLGVQDGRRRRRAARDREGTLALPRPEFQLANVARLPFDDASFDKAVAADLVEHLDDETFLAMLRETRRVLRPGGTLSIYTPNPRHPIERLKSRDLILAQNPTHIGLRDRANCESMLRAELFDVELSEWRASFIRGLRVFERAGGGRVEWCATGSACAPDDRGRSESRGRAAGDRAGGRAGRGRGRRTVPRSASGWPGRRWQGTSRRRRAGGRGGSASCRRRGPAAPRSMKTGSAAAIRYAVESSEKTTAPAGTWRCSARTSPGVSPGDAGSADQCEKPETTTGSTKSRRDSGQPPGRSSERRATRATRSAACRRSRRTSQKRRPRSAGEPPKSPGQARSRPMPAPSAIGRTHTPIARESTAAPPANAKASGAKPNDPPRLRERDDIGEDAEEGRDERQQRDDHGPAKDERGPAALPGEGGQRYADQRGDGHDALCGRERARGEPVLRRERVLVAREALPDREARAGDDRLGLCRGGLLLRCAVDVVELVVEEQEQRQLVGVALRRRRLVPGHGGLRHVERRACRGDGRQRRVGARDLGVSRHAGHHVPAVRAERLLLLRYLEDPGGSLLVLGHDRLLWGSCRRGDRFPARGPVPRSADP